MVYSIVTYTFFFFSDSNHFCCKNCGIVPVDSKVCHSVGNISNDCTRETPCK